jgi:metal-dependent HD superfamily phosphatase/phosphodiesterase
MFVVLVVQIPQQLVYALRRPKFQTVADKRKFSKKHYDLLISARKMDAYQDSSNCASLIATAYSPKSMVYEKIANFVENNPLFMAN